MLQCQIPCLLPPDELEDIPTPCDLSSLTLNFFLLNHITLLNHIYTNRYTNTAFNLSVSLLVGREGEY